MATALVRSGLLRTALRGGARNPAAPKRNFASSAHHDDAYETAKWEKITYLGIATCTVLAIYNLSKGHPHHDEPPVSFPLYTIYNCFIYIFFFLSLFFPVLMHCSCPDEGLEFGDLWISIEASQ
ncbi:hypothetical protein Ahy_B01g053240 isoform B [Arachis hypogaea]|uniref:Cytochrome c oxidase subunit 6a n=1 Tax=Arachis hypogaea TaxID=3818 RepID=A0A445ARG0_ARAHY|nr:hypothetical protein Ahy_B01g053240 isoform B [Arachis hypogaea]